MANNHYIKRLVACAVQFDKDFHKMEGGIPALDNITELILYINQTMDVSKKEKDELDDIDTKCLLSGVSATNQTHQTANAEIYFKMQQLILLLHAERTTFWIFKKTPLAL